MAEPRYDFKIHLGSNINDAKVTIAGKELKGVKNVSLRPDKDGTPLVIVTFCANSVDIEGNGRVIGSPIKQ
jgi:hypothetical protein